jgi:putative ABC transport system permease protein
VESELDAELRAHLEHETEKHVRAGLSFAEAQRRARLDLGGLEQVKEECRDARGVNFVETTIQDLRYGLRQLRRNPAFTAVAVLTLALGIGANTAIFSVVNAVLLNPLPFPEPGRLIGLHASYLNFEFGNISFPNFLDWRKENHSFSAMAVFRSIRMSLTGLGEAERVNAEFITSGLFPLLGVKPLLGRTLAPGEDRIGAAPVVLINERLWRRKFEASPDVLGKVLTLDGKGFTIVGVIPATFHMGLMNADIPDRDAYVPLGQWVNHILMVRGAGLGIAGVGRLKPGVTLKQARADMAAVTAALAQAYPDADRGVGATLLPLKDEIVGNVRPLLWVLLGAVGFVLLIACVNVANLLLARAITRRREFAIRSALGAGRRRVVRQLLVESMLLATAGGAFGLLLAFWGTRAGLGLLPSSLPRSNEVGVDMRVLIFTALVSLLAGIVFGVAPAIKGSRQDLRQVLNEGGRRESGARHRAQGTLVAIEMALALVLLVGAGLMIRSMARLWNVDPGFNPRNLLIFGYAFPPSMSAANAGTMQAKCRELEGKIESIPHVDAVALTWAAFPMDGGDDVQFWVEGRPKPHSENAMKSAVSYDVGPQYFRAMGIPLLRGRVFSDQDNEQAPRAVVVDEVFARKFFPSQNPLGKRIVTNGIHSSDFDQVAEIVGVVGHVKQWGLGADDANPLRAQVYRPLAQLPVALKALPVTGIGVVVRSNAEPPALMGAIRRATGELSKEGVVWGVRTVENIISESLSTRQFAMTLLGAFAGLALLLAGLGIYGVVSYLVGRRTHEIGVRMALGAERRDVLRIVLGEGLRVAFIGIALGVAGALALTRFLSGSLYGVTPTDPLTFILVSLLLTVVALVAAYIPAHRATRVDPMAALRCE